MRIVRDGSILLGGCVDDCVRPIFVHAKHVENQGFANFAPLRGSLLPLDQNTKVELGIIIKTKRPNNKKTNLYLLTDKGLALTPILVELATWSDSYLRDIHPTIVNGKAMELLRDDKAAFASALEIKYREKLATIVYR